MKLIRALGGALCFASAAVYAGNVLDTFSVGGILVQTQESKLKVPSECVLEKGPEEDMDGAIMQEWDYKNCGINLYMVKDPESKVWRIFAATFTAPSKLKSKENIGIGSTVEDVIRTYGNQVNKAESSDQEIVLGSIYGGVILTIENRKVSQIFLGAAAE